MRATVVVPPSLSLSPLPVALQDHGRICRRLKLSWPLPLAPALSSLCDSRRCSAKAATLQLRLRLRLGLRLGLSWLWLKLGSSAVSHRQSRLLQLSRLSNELCADLPRQADTRITLRSPPPLSLPLSRFLSLLLRLLRPLLLLIFRH